MQSTVKLLQILQKYCKYCKSTENNAKIQHAVFAAPDPPGSSKIHVKLGP